MTDQAIQIARLPWSFWKVVFAGVLIILLSGAVMALVTHGSPVALKAIGISLKGMFGASGMPI